METLYFFECEFPAVFLVNGVFFPSLTRLKAEPSDSLYITVLPLDAVYLPYTVRIGGGAVYANAALTVFYRLKGERYLARFLPRFNYVYTPVRHEHPKTDAGAARRLFDAISRRDVTSARALLTPELSASVDDNSLLALFDGYCDLVENNGYVSGEINSFFLIPAAEGEAALFRVEYKNGLIDNIDETE